MPRPTSTPPDPAPSAWEAGLRRMAESSPDAILRYDPAGRIRYLNARLACDLGVTPDALLGRTTAEAWPDGRFAEIEAAVLDAARTGTATTLDLDHALASGRHTSSEVRVVPERDEAGVLVGAFAFVRDISGRKRMEAELAQREREFRTLAENSPDPIFRYDRAGRRLYVNPAAARLARRPAAALLGATPEDTALFAPDEARRLTEAIRRVVEGGAEGRLEVQLADPDGHPQRFDTLLVPELDPAGRVVQVLCLGRNITALREAEQHAARFVANMPGFAYTFHMPPEGAPCFPFASPGIAKIYGLRPEEVQDDMAPLHALAHPEDRPRIEAALAEAAWNFAPFHFEFRVCRPGQPERWVECRALPERQPDGSLLSHGIMLDITARKREQGRLELMERAINQSSEGFFLIDDEARFVDVNEAACRSLGYTREELLRLSPPDIDPDITREALLGLMRREGGGPITFETRHRTKDGRLFPVELTGANFVHEGARYSLTLVRDISERREMLARLAQSEREFRSLAENLPDNVARWDTEGRYLYINPTQARLLGRANEAVAGRRIDQIFPSPDGQAGMAAIRRVATTGLPELVARVPVSDADGEVRIHDIKMVPEHDADGAVVGVLGLGRDMTELYRLQEAVAEREEEASRLQRLQTANELATALAHEINQPLAAIATYADAGRKLMRHPNPDLECVADTLERIGQQALRAGDTIRHLRRFVGRGRIEPVPLDLATAAERACGLIAAKARGAGIRLEIDAEPGLPPVLGVDVQVEQVLLNLLRNAQEAIQGEGRAGGRIQLRLRQADGMACVTVEDDGPGIDAELAGRLFTPFSSTKADGLGVGLRISRNLIEAHGGRLWFEAHTPGGCFHFTLPLAPRDPPCR